MRSAAEKLQELKPNSVWVFTKQETDFDESYDGIYDNRYDISVSCIGKQNCRGAS